MNLHIIDKKPMSNLKIIAKSLLAKKTDEYVIEPDLRKEMWKYTEKTNSEQIRQWVLQRVEPNLASPIIEYMNTLAQLRRIEHAVPSLPKSSPFLANFKWDGRSVQKIEKFAEEMNLLTDRLIRLRGNLNIVQESVDKAENDVEIF